MKKRRTVNLDRSKVDNGQIVETNGYRCSKCSKVLSCPSNLVRHHRNVHNFKAPNLRLKCAYCTRILSSRESKILHENRHLKKAMLRDKFEVWKCSHCPAMFKFEQDKMNHEKEHLENTTRVDKTNPTVWNCSYCPSTFKLEVNKIIHEKKHLEKAKVSMKTTNVLKCSRCPSTFKREAQKRYHEQKVHSGRNSFVCNLCRGSFNKLVSLSWHKYVYHWNGKKPRAKSTTLEKKDIEIKVVSRKRKRVKLEPVTARTKNGVEMVYANKLTCSYCPKFLASVTGKTIHEKKHIGEQPFCCKFCSMTFDRVERQNKHQRECRYLDAMSFCKICDFHTLIRSQLASHYKRSHGFTFESDIELEFFRREILVECNPTSEIVPESPKYNRIEPSNEDELTKNEDNPNSESNDDDPSSELNEDDPSSELNDDDPCLESNDDDPSSESNDELDESNESSIFESSFEHFQDTRPVKDHEMQVSTENNLLSNGFPGFSQTNQVEEMFQRGTCFSQINDRLEEMFRDHDSNHHQSESSMSKNVTETEVERTICETEVSQSNDELREVLQDDVTNQLQSAAGDCLEEQINPYHGIRIKSEIICTYSEAFSETDMQRDPPDEKLIKYEVEVAQINSNLRGIFQTDQIAENWVNSEWQDEQNSSCRVVDLTNEDSDDEVESPIIIIDDDD